MAWALALGQRSGLTLTDYRESVGNRRLDDINRGVEMGPRPWSHKRVLRDPLPTKETSQKVYDNLDFMRGVEVFLNFVPAASIEAHPRRLGGQWA